MKKCIVAIIAFMMFSGVQAWADKECTALQVEEGQTLLGGVTYSIEYADNYMDFGGNFQEGYMRFKLANLPSGYYASIKTNEGNFVLNDNQSFAHISGGVHEIVFYSNACDSPIKSFGFKVPHYKQFCGKDTIKCEENAWFDGTYENSIANQNKKPKSKLSIILIVVLVVLILVIVIFIVVTIKRRKARERGF